MAGFHLPGDPYFPHWEANGWIEDHDPEAYEPEQDTETTETEPEEDPSEPESDHDLMEVDAEGATEEIPVEEDDLDMAEWEGESEGDSDGSGPSEVPDHHLSPDRGSDTTVDSPVVHHRREIVRSRHDPLPPPSSQVYRHPGGVRWKNTPRKRVPIPLGHGPCQVPTPDLPATYAPCRPEWATRLRDWSFAQELPPPFALGQTSFDLGAGTIADRALPVTVGRITRIEASLTATHQQLADDQRRQEQQTQEMMEQLGEAHGEIHRLRSEQTGFRDRIAMMDAHIADLAEQVEAATRATAEATARLNRHLKD